MIKSPLMQEKGSMSIVGVKTKNPKNAARAKALAAYSLCTVKDPVSKTMKITHTEADAL